MTTTKRRTPARRQRKAARALRYPDTKWKGNPVSPEAILALTRRSHQRQPWVTLSDLRRAPAAYQKTYLRELRLVILGLADLVDREIRSDHGGLAAMVIELRTAGRVHFVIRRTRSELARGMLDALADTTFTAQAPPEAPKKKRRAR